jgi:E3 ubiquitin-protein ligase BRE1
MDDLRMTVANIISNTPQAASDAIELQNSVARLLAAEKHHIQRYEEARTQVDDLQQQSDDYKYKWGIARAQLAKAQSQTKAFLELQTKSNIPESQPKPKPETNGREVNGTKETEIPLSNESNTTLNAIQAELVKRKEHLAILEQENTKLKTELSTVQVKFIKLSDDDYSKTDLFKLLKAQHNDVVKRLNNLEAVNTQLREENQKLNAERTAYRLKVDREFSASNQDMEARMATLEEDTQRIRAQRDEASIEKTILDQSQAKHDESLSTLKSLNEANEERVKGLEDEVQRLKIKLGEESASAGVEIPADCPSSIRDEFQKLQSQHDLLNQELSSMQTALTKFRGVATEKAKVVLRLEKEVEALKEITTKAESKRYSEKQLMEIKRNECESMRKQHQKSGEIISQLKDTDIKTRELVVNLEKQNAEYKDQVLVMTEANHSQEQRISQLKLTLEKVSKQVEDVGKTVAAKDEALAQASHAQREAEAESAGFKVKFEETKKKIDQYKTKDKGEDPENQLDMLKVSSTRIFTTSNANKH